MDFPATDMVDRYHQIAALPPKPDPIEALGTAIAAIDKDASAAEDARKLARRHDLQRRSVYLKGIVEDYPVEISPGHLVPILTHQQRHDLTAAGHRTVVTALERIRDQLRAWKDLDLIQDAVAISRALNFERRLLDEATQNEANFGVA